VKSVREALKTLPKSLSGTYARTLKSLEEDHREYALKVLMWFAMSSKPCNIQEVAEVLTIDMEAEDGPVYDEELRLPNPADILSMCTSLGTAATVAKLAVAVKSESSFE
jgi:hypothetical protein